MWAMAAAAGLARFDALPTRLAQVSAPTIPSAAPASGPASTSTFASASASTSASRPAATFTPVSSCIHAAFKAIRRRVVLVLHAADEFVAEVGSSPAGRHVG